MHMGHRGDVGMLLEQFGVATKTALAFAVDHLAFKIGDRRLQRFAVIPWTAVVDRHQQLLARYTFDETDGAVGRNGVGFTEYGEGFLSLDQHLVDKVLQFFADQLFVDKYGHGRSPDSGAALGQQFMGGLQRARIDPVGDGKIAFQEAVQVKEIFLGIEKLQSL
ncbi:hypothetical protein D3C76_896850 [compost metagenome]